MNNVITLTVPQWRGPHAKRGHDRLTRLAQAFCSERRGANDVFWLKENAEFLNVLETSGQDASKALEAYEPFYETLEEKLQFFPQYYRFILSICIDFEDLTSRSLIGERMAHWVALQALPMGELSDLQRLEAYRLLARRGVDMTGLSDGLLERVHGFMGQTDLFALPNKKIAYELTHLVFYLSEYGRVDPQLTGAAKTSLRHVGLWAFLELNADLLAEVCIALKFAGETPPKNWTRWLVTHLEGYSFAPGSAAVAGDSYHEFLMCQWAEMVVSDQDGFSSAPPVGVTPVFQRPAPSVEPLREVSQTLLGMAGTRSSSWSVMRPLLLSVLSEGAGERLSQAEASCAGFSEFFSKFARAGQDTRAYA